MRLLKDTIYKLMEIKEKSRLIDKEGINNNIKEVINNLEKIKFSDFMMNDEEVYLFFQNIYIAMKLEIMFVGSTTLLEYLKNNELYQKKITELIKEDVNNLRKNSLALKECFYQVFMLDSEKTEDLYNPKTIQLILKYDKNFAVFRNFIIQKCYRLINQHEDNLLKLFKKNITIEERKNDLAKLQELFKKNKKNLSIRISSMALTLGIIFGSITFTNSTLKKSSTTKVYGGIEKSYSDSYDAKQRQVTSEPNEIPTDSVIINDYSKVFDNQRTISSYDVSDFEFMNSQDYLNMDLTNMDYDINLIPYDSTTLSDEYKEVIITKYDKSKKHDKLEIQTYYKLLGMFVLWLELVCDLIPYMVLNKKEKQLLIGIVNNLLQLLKNKEISLYKFNKKSLYKLEVEIKSLTKVIKNINIEDVKLKEQFYKFYDEYNYFMDYSEFFLDYFEKFDYTYTEKMIRRKFY